MNRASRILLLVVLPAILIPGCGSETVNTAERVLGKVEERYRNLDRFEFRATFSTVFSQGINSQKYITSVHYLANRPGGLRIEVTQEENRDILVSNGETTWTYRSSLDQYTVQPVSPYQTAEGAYGLRAISGNMLETADLLTAAFERITLNLRDAVVIGQQRIELESGARMAYVVEAKYEGEGRNGDRESWPVTYWIDKTTSLVLRQRIRMNTTDPQSGERIRMMQEIALSEARLNPDLTENLFEFMPPPTAERVDELPVGGARKPMMVGQEAEDFTLENVEGDAVSLSQHRGKVVLLDFWATWCGPCLEAHPVIDRIYQEWKDEGLVVIGISSESRESIQQYMGEHGYTFMNLFDRNHSVSREYNVDVIPAVFIIDREGEIAAQMVGAKSEQTLRRAIREAGL